MLELFLAAIVTVYELECKGARIQCANSFDEGFNCKTVDIWRPCVLNDRDKDGETDGIVCSSLYLNYDKNECKVIDHRNVFVPNAPEEGR